MTEFSDLPLDQRKVIKDLISRNYIVKMEGEGSLRVFLESYEDSFVAFDVYPFRVSQIHPYRENDKPFAAKILLTTESPPNHRS